MARSILSIGTLGAARIAPAALMAPVRRLPDVRVTAVAARQRERAEHFARRHQIERVYDSYEQLIHAPDIDAIYIPLPNSLHREWTLRALRAGKHVLCEKPFAATADEAEEMAAAAHESGRVLMEAFHNLYHPLAARIKAIVDGGELGTLRRVESHFCTPIWRPNDIRFRADLAGGATMDLGCYSIRLLRFVTGAEPEVTGATAQWTASGVDRTMDARLAFPGGVQGRVLCSFLSRHLVRVSLSAYGERGELHVLNPVLPHFFHRVTVRTATGTRSERIPGGATYDYQLRAFAAAIRHGAPVLTDAADAVRTMRVVDACYARAKAG